MKRTAAIVALALICLSSTAFAAGMPAQKRADILKLLNLTVRQSFEIGARQGLDRSDQKQNPMFSNPDSKAQIGLAIHEILDDEFSPDKTSSDFVAAMVNNYNKNFNDAEIQQMLAFYSSDIGQRAVAIQTREGIENGDGLRGWALSITGKALQRIAEKLKAPPTTPAPTPTRELKTGT